nr:hypothetical protein [Tanacetum cinerariifolium]
MAKIETSGSKGSPNFFIIAVQTPGSGISILLAVGTPSTGSGNLYCQWELSPGSGNTLIMQVTRQETNDVMSLESIQAMIDREIQRNSTHTVRVEDS